MESCISITGEPLDLSSTVDVLGDCVPLSSFQNLEVVGQGNYGKVYRATRARTNPPPSAPSSSFNPINPSQKSDDRPEIVALKEYYLTSEHFEDGYPTYPLREISLLRSLKHENVIRLIEVAVGGARPDDFWMVLEYVQEDLESLVESKSAGGSEFHISQVKSYAYQLLSGLEYIHSKEIVHRDICPGNILISDTGALKIADFGMARSIHAAYDQIKSLPCSDNIPKRPLTDGVTTIWYRAPEICLRTFYYDSSADIWSAGLVIAELLLMTPAIEGKDDLDQLQQTENFLGKVEDDDLDSFGENMNCPALLGHIGNKVFGRDIEGNMEKRLLDAGADEGTIQFLRGLIKWDPVKRWTASEALGKVMEESLREAWEWWEGWPRPMIDGRDVEVEGDDHLEEEPSDDEEEASEESLGNHQITPYQSRGADMRNQSDEEMDVVHRPSKRQKHDLTIKGSQQLD